MHTAAAEAPDNYIFRKLIRLIINAVYRTGALSYFSYKYREREGESSTWASLGVVQGRRNRASGGI